MQTIIEACQYLLHHYHGAEEVREYLNSRLNNDSQKQFQFGYYPKQEELSLLTDLVGQEILEENCLVYHKSFEDALFPRHIQFSYFDRYPLVVPFRDAYGDVKGIVGRTLLTAEEQKNQNISKYKNTKNFKKGNCLFGLYENKQNIIQKNCVYIVEGQFDVIKAAERGFNNIVAIGTSTMTLYQFSIITRYTSNLILLLDNDEAGQRGRQSIAEKFGQWANIQDFYISNDFKDIDEYLGQCEGEPIFEMRA